MEDPLLEKWKFGLKQEMYSTKRVNGRFTRLTAAASFFGDGYIHLRTAEASIQTMLHVRFRTSAQAGLLFLAAGRRDFLLLEMIGGRLQVKI